MFSTIMKQNTKIFGCSIFNKIDNACYRVMTSVIFLNSFILEKLLSSNGAWGPNCCDCDFEITWDGTRPHLFKV